MRSPPREALPQQAPKSYDCRRTGEAGTRPAGVAALRGPPIARGKGTVPMRNRRILALLATAARYSTPTAASRGSRAHDWPAQ